jgi:plasmid stabilization system protein ParE
LGDAFGSRLAATIQRIAEYPGFGKQVDGTFRVFLIQRFPLTVVYVVEQQRVIVVALAHQSRRAGYWINRY